MYGLHRLGIRPGLGRIRSLLRLLGDPHRGSPALHVAGTNGKGSTSAMLESILIEAGYSVGLYTSPHLIKFNERIRVNKEPVRDKDVVRLASVVKKAAPRLKDTPTFFEFTTAMAFLYFKEKKTDIVILEVGMGGRLDATNVTAPLVSLITNVGFDHMEYLGKSIKKIAREKAGIIKKNIPVVTASGDEGALKEFARASREKDAPMYSFGKDFTVKATESGRQYGHFDYYGIKKNFKGLKLNIRGEHQYKNAACALAALELISSRGYRIHEKAARGGLKKVVWPGRFEIVKKRPLVILDCAHNPDGARTLRDALGYFHTGNIILVLGIMADKDIEGILRELAPLSTSVILTRPGTERAADPLILAEKILPYGKKTVIKRTVREACEEALKEAKLTDTVCVTGSIFTVGEAKKHFSLVSGK